MGIFEKRTSVQGKTQVPVWFMRQAGRYHKHYQNIRAQKDFMHMCKDPTLAAEITMGPIDEFDFDAAILFSDLLFPLEHLGMGLSYAKGPPELAWHLKTPSDVERLALIDKAESFYSFQRKALELLKTKLPSDKTLLGFVGAPFTLYTYAVCGSHSGSLVEAKVGLYNSLYSQFLKRLLPSVKDQMFVQARGGADAVCIFDTAAGELSLSDYQQFVVPSLKDLATQFKKEFPNVKLLYYSKHTHLPYLKTLEGIPLDALGVDWRMDLKDALTSFGDKSFIQGNLDPCWLSIEWKHLERHLKDLWERMRPLEDRLEHWIFGLGHGCLPQSNQDNVKRVVEWCHKHMHY